MPSVLEKQLEQQVIAPFSSDVSTYYNAFYTAYSWSNMVMSLLAGAMVDRLGAKKCAFIFLSNVSYFAGNVIISLSESPSDPHWLLCRLRFRFRSPRADRIGHPVQCP